MAPALSVVLVYGYVVHEGLDDEAAEALFIGDNYNRRHLSEVQKMRCVARRVELARQGKAALPPECNGLKKTRDIIGKLVGCSGKTADRYLKALSSSFALFER